MLRQWRPLATVNYQSLKWLSNIATSKPLTKQIHTTKILETPEIQDDILRSSNAQSKLVLMLILVLQLLKMPIADAG